MQETLAYEEAKVLYFAFLLLNKSNIPNEPFKYTSKIWCWSLYLCLYFSCLETFKCQKVKHSRW